MSKKFLPYVFILFSFLLAANVAFAQNYWQAMPGAPTGATSITLDASNGNIWVGTGAPAADVYLYDGTTWALKTRPGGAEDVISIAVDPTDSDIIYVSKSGGNVYKSIDAGATWSTVFTNTSYTYNILINSSGQVYFGTVGNGFYRPNGAIWEQANTGLGNLNIRPLCSGVGTRSNRIFAGTESGIWYTDNNGNSWTQSSGYTTAFITDFTVVDDNTIFATASSTGGVLKSTNGGVNWTQVITNDLARIIYNSTTGHLFAIGTSGVYRSTDLGQTWSSVITPITGSYLRLAFNPISGQTYVSSGASVYEGLPVIQTTPATTLAFGNVADGYFKVDSVTIKNIGIIPLEITNITPLPSQFSLSGTYTFPITVPINDSIKIIVRFSPDNVVPFTGTLTLAHNASGGSTTINLSGTGVAAEPEITITPDPLAFATTPIGSFLDSTINIKNSGNSPLTISGISIVSGDPEFTLPNDENTTVTVGTPITVAPGGTYPLSVRFSPTDTTDYIGSLEIIHDAISGSPSTIDLSGKGVNANIGIDVSYLDFGNVKVGTSLEKSIKIINSGTTFLVISDVTLPAGFTLPRGDSSMITVYPNSYYELWVRFTPTSATRYVGAITLEHNSIGSPTSVPVYGTGVIIALDVTPTTIDFDTTKLGAQKDSLVTLINSGTIDVTITGVTILENGSTSFFYDFITPLTIKPNTAINIPLTFYPTSLGEKNATLTINHDIDGENPKTVMLKGTVIGPIINIAPLSFDFYDVLVNSSKDEIITISNEGSMDLEISSLSFTGDDSTMFVFTSLPNLPIIIAPSESLELVLTFLPTSVGEKNATLEIEHNYYTLVSIIPLTGRGIKPEIVIVPETLDFGDVLIARAQENINYDENIKYFELKNVGTAPLVISGFLQGGTNVADFTRYSDPDSNDIKATIAPEESATFYVKFNPTIDGQKSATWYINHNADNSPTALYLQGKGVSPNIVIEDNLNLGEVMVDSSIIKNITITNSGDGPLIITSFVISSKFFSFPNDENLTDITNPIRIEAGDSYDLFVQFLPTDSIRYNGTITLIHNGTGSPSHITLEGRGIIPILIIDPTILRIGLDFGDVFVGSSPADQSIRMIENSDPTQLENLDLSLSIENVESYLAELAVGQAALVIGNEGTGDVVVTSYSIKGDDADMFDLILEYNVPNIIKPTHAIVPILLFNPTSAGPKQAELHITHNGSSAPVIIQLIGNGVWQRIALTPYDTLNFGGVPVNRSTKNSITINNTGATAITITELEITGTNASMFKRVVPFEEIIIEALESRLIEFEFIPTSGGVKNATLVLTHDLGTSEIDLTGVGLVANMTVTPDRLQFGDVQVGDYKHLTINIQNTGTAPFIIAGLKFTGQNTSCFSVFSDPDSFDTDIIVLPSVTYTNTIIFSPDAIGEKGAFLEIITDLITVRSISLLGTGINQQVSVEELEDLMGDGTTFLFQNSPNPVRSGYDASIRYRLNSEGHVTLIVYDVIGREVAKLVDEHKPYGVHSVNFNTRNLTSGVYFYKLRTPGYEGLKKMLIVR